MAKPYFDSETEAGIIAFQQESDIEKRKEIFVSRVRPSFLKLIENITYVYSFKSLENIEILENDCMSSLFECLCKFDPKKGAAFSYFNMVCKNWFLQEVKLRKKRIRQDIPIVRELIEESEDSKKFVIDPFENTLIDFEFLKCLKEDMKTWGPKIKNEQERRVLNAILYLFEQIDSIPLYNKKGIYLNLRDICQLNTKQIALNLNKLKKRYFLFKKKFLEGKI